jgi:hypothetical protein
MENKVLVNISWCASHHKGANSWDGAQRLHGETHARWLEQAVDFYAGQNFPVIVSCTDWRGILNADVSPGNHERDVLWRVLKKAPIIGMADNPGHQVGAALCIRQGLEAAGKWEYPLLIHTAEDVLPRPGMLDEMLQALDDGCDYSGTHWGSSPPGYNSQFFACRVQALVPYWDSCRVPEQHHLEGYLKHLLEGRPAWLGAERYFHTHDYALWQAELKKEYGL